MKVETVSIQSLILDPANVRKHDSKNLEAIKGSLVKFGQQKPIVVGKDNIVIAGNGTLEAARDLGWTEIKIIRSDLKDSMATAYAIADNRTTDLSVFDEEALNKSLAALSMEGFDVGTFGFDEFDMEDVITGNEKEIDGSKELSEDDFSEFDNKCPRCGFEFDAKD